MPGFGSGFDGAPSLERVCSSSRPEAHDLTSWHRHARVRTEECRLEPPEMTGDEQLGEMRRRLGRGLLPGLLALAQTPQTL